MMKKPCRTHQVKIIEEAAAEWVRQVKPARQSAFVMPASYDPCTGPTSVPLCEKQFEGMLKFRTATAWVESVPVWETR